MGTACWDYCVHLLEATESYLAIRLAKVGSMRTDFRTAFQRRKSKRRPKAKPKAKALSLGLPILEIIINRAVPMPPTFE